VNANLNTQVLEHLERSESEDDYAAINTLWIGLTKAAQAFDGDEAHRGMSLLEAIGAESLVEVVHSSGVDELLALDPPIETILTYPGEEDWLDAIAAAERVFTIREFRDSEPLRASVALIWLLRRVRNRVDHGFKTPKGSRDQEVMRATRATLDAFVRAAIEVD
jgi:hypothetical protein